MLTIGQESPSTDSPRQMTDEKILNFNELKAKGIIGFENGFDKIVEREDTSRSLPYSKTNWI
jgi:hypothetical protein